MNSIPNSFKNHIPLDFKNVHTIPNSHEWTLPNDHTVAEPQTFGSMPIINLSDPNAKSLIRHACEKWGVFQVINHGVPLNLLNEVELLTHRLFSLPTHRKICALRSPDGITGYGLPQISSFFPKLMWTEGFTMVGSPVEHATLLWPHQPNEQTNFCTVMEEYQKEMKKSTERLVELMLGSLGLTSKDIEWLKPKTGCNKAQSLLHLNSYPACPEPDRAMGLGPHTDSSVVTVVYQSTCNGLQVHGDGIGWMAVQPIPGALVVNVGDLMHILSNGQFKSPLHRAVVNKTRHRISVAYFYGPPKDVKISPLTDHDHPPLYSPVTWKEYLGAKSMHFNNALELIKNNKNRNGVISSK
ncbi:gibberellin 3-beta-dioxygenase 3-like [Gastrolobium bilobum]|uniref:gibberellin 3-beta-dioxygenase 3-like n=1 Tax=Gastrolobium bilobum TaxID=150636 RepID=UPI002AB0394E|nr:gibberellin 3-beta-dioxygenase 3-like [Gastrolobium bilobum]